ncbi:MAG: glycosyltransferase family 39 protein [Burkholderiaceae bacterium]
MRELHASKAFVAALLVAFALIWFYALGARTLVPTDEGRYAEMAREMVVTGDYITPRLNGIKYFEKPPLQTWMNALTFEAFGFGAWQARLWTGLCGFLTVLLVGFTGRAIFNARVGFNAALVLGSSLYWAALGHVNTLDMGLSAMMALSLCALLLAQRRNLRPAECRNWMLVCWGAMALAVLSKGLIGVVLPGAVLVCYTLYARDWAIWKRAHLGSGLLLFLLICAPWFVLVSLKNPEFPRFFFIHEHFQRFTSKIHHRYAPPYYFIPILLIGIVPWLGMLFQSLWAVRAEPRASRSTDGPLQPGFQPRRLRLTWAVFIFAFFSISDSKLPSYILPIFPALALLIACHLEYVSKKTLALTAGLVALLGLVGLLLSPKLVTLARNAYELPLYQQYLPWTMVGALIALGGGIAAARLASRRAGLSVAVLAASTFVCGQVLLIGHEPLGRYAAGTVHVPAIEAVLTPTTPLYVVGRYEQVLPFYLGRTMTMVEHADELEFGLEQEPQLWFPTLAGFTEKWTADAAAGVNSVAILEPKLYRTLRDEGLPMRVIAEDPRRIVVASLPAGGAKDIVR